jgi:hypothetical protein
MVAICVVAVLFVTASFCFTLALLVCFLHQLYERKENFIQYIDLGLNSNDSRYGRHRDCLRSFSVCVFARWMERRMQRIVRAYQCMAAKKRKSLRSRQWNKV